MIKKERRYMPSSREMDALLALVRRRKTDAFPNDMDWNRFDYLVRKNTLISQMLGGIKQFPPEVIQKHPVLSDYLKMQSYYVSHSMTQMKLLAALAAEFEKRGIRALSLKGPLLAMELYGNPSVRFSGDLDFFIEPDQHDAACRCLEAFGFAVQHHPESVFDRTPKRRASRELSQMEEDKHSVYVRGDMAVELHHQLSTRWEADFDGLWERSREQKMLGQTVRCLGANDNIMYLISHAAGHGFFRLSWLMDLYILMSKPGFSADALFGEMAERGIGMLLIETLLLIYRIPGLEMPMLSAASFAFERTETGISVSFDEKLKQDFIRGIALADCAAPSLLTTEKMGTVVGRKHTWLLPTPGKKQTVFTFLLSFIQPCEADLELINLPDSLFFLYYVIRPFYFIWRKTPFYHADNHK